ncbi:MAG: response regulator transcription factor [Tannerellaceae bacterium]|nr:response regulator transcription factor [Tannerellaceae bacterium]
MRRIKVLLVEDEEILASIIKDTLEGEEFQIELAFNGQEGLEKLPAINPDIIVTDIMMPGMDGFTMVKKIRENGLAVPVLFLSARSSANDVVEGFELGGNDYLKKPFGMAELAIRIKALLNRINSQPAKQDVYEIGNYKFDPVTQNLFFAGNKQALSNRESEILKRFCDNINQVVSTQDILLELWGDDSFFNTRSLHVFITKLRHKLSKDPRIQILNVRGIGYKMIVE